MQHRLIKTVRYGLPLETGTAQLKTHLRGPGRVLRSKSPDMVRQEIYGHLLTHYAISALICRAATEASASPDPVRASAGHRVKFKRTVRVVRRRAADPAAFPPEQRERILEAVMAGHHQEKAPQPGTPAPDISEGGQASPPQLLPGQAPRRPRHPPFRTRHDQPGQPPPAHTRSMINLG